MFPYLKRLVLPLFFLPCTAVTAIADGDCPAALEQALQDSDTANALKALVEPCADDPLVRHNLGVLAVQEARYDDAIGYFESVLQALPVTAASYERLQTLHRHRAVTAYRQALESALPAPAPPDFDFLPPELSSNTAALREIFTQWWREQCAEADCADSIPPFRPVRLDKNTVLLLQHQDDSVSGPAARLRRGQWQRLEGIPW
ncbi:hypothetical protein Q4485_01880 [Granulosicoccaceae sp. 1_MG-2023]|nr:hypothetical protein [Granulosicoccaceae sp. 1_MG-2023]